MAAFTGLTCPVCGGTDLQRVAPDLFRCRREWLVGVRPPGPANMLMPEFGRCRGQVQLSQDPAVTEHQRLDAERRRVADSRRRKELAELIGALQGATDVETLRAAIADERFSEIDDVTVCRTAFVRLGRLGGLPRPSEQIVTFDRRPARLWTGIGRLIEKEREVAWKVPDAERWVRADSFVYAHFVLDAAPATGKPQRPARVGERQPYVLAPLDNRDGYPRDQTAILLAGEPLSRRGRTVTGAIAVRRHEPQARTDMRKVVAAAEA